MKKKVSFDPIFGQIVTFLPTGPSNGEEWLWEDEYEVHHIRQLYRERHQKIGRHE